MRADVLIIDDSLTVRMDLGEAFELAGFKGRLCSTLKEARDALSKSFFSLIILDVLLPDGDGVEFMREIKTNPSVAGIPVILLSSEAEVRDRVRGMNTGADEYVGKPYDQAHVVARARELLRKNGSSPELTKSRTVLVIDDSVTFREELKSMLESSGYSVVVAGSGEDGLQLAVDQRPSVVVVDGLLPGIDGPTVIRRIRADAALRSTPCILLTASEGRTSELKALDAGADAYVRKDEDTRVILARVTAVLRSSRVPSSVGRTSSLLAPKRILTVDDSVTHLNEVATQLREEGYDVVPARSGEEALELLSVQPVDCILLDLVMPGLSGKETCRRIKNSAEWRDIPLIMHTALEEQDAMIEGINAGADDYIIKSSDPEVLSARVRAQLRRKQFEDENRDIREQLLQKELEVTLANSARELAETRAAFVEELERKNSELEAFSYSVSHDLRAPLRSIAGFSQILLQDYSAKLDEEGKNHLVRVVRAAQRMGELIDALLQLSRLGRTDLCKEHVNLSAIAHSVLEELSSNEPERKVEFRIEDEVFVNADRRLVRVALENLLGNAWKFTAKVAAKIEFGAEQRNDGPTYFVRDNGAGFSMEHAEKLFSPFQRLHRDADFPGTGIGLATVHRVVFKHGGRIWAEAAPEKGATFFFTLGRNG